MQAAPRHVNDKGLVAVHLFVVYGVYGDAAATNELLVALDQWLQTFSEQEPIIIVGDFNAETDELPVLCQWRNSNLFVDVHDLAHTRFG